MCEKTPFAERTFAERGENCLRRRSEQKNFR